mgnify:CR=1 FL=1
MRTFPVIRTERFLLKQITKDNATVLNGVFEDDKTRKYLLEVYSLIDLDDGILYFISTFDTYTKKGEGYLWGIYCNNDKLIGFVAVMDLSNSPTLFYAMHPIYRLQGYMKCAIYAVIDYLGKSKKNNISIHILKQLGFSAYREGDDKVYFSKVLAQ